MARHLVAVLAGAAAACSHHHTARQPEIHRDAVYHEVHAGENLYRIGKAYGVAVARLAEVNHLADPSRLEVGQRLLIPDASRELPVDVITPRASSLRPPHHDELPKGSVLFAWPVDGTVTSTFGQRGRGFHDGIDIGAPAGAPVHAAQDGEVIYSDVLRGYGNVIILRHPQGFATVYAHNQSNGVHEGQRVHRGEVIACVGQSGRTSGTNLHFEVRQDNVARNPLYFLPPASQAAAPLSLPLPGG